MIAAASLLIGSAGYHVFAEVPWVDSLLNASTILTGKGPVDRLDSVAGKLFATVYSLYRGVAFLTTMAVLLAPVVHRFVHTLHLEEDREPD